MTDTTVRSRWLPLESNPQVMNEFIYNLGVSPLWAYTDVWGLEPELLQMIPQPVAAVLLLFPITENYERFRREEQEQLLQAGQVVSQDIVYFKQTISNACGTIGLLHSLANNMEVVNIEDGPLKRLLQRCESLAPEERAKLLEEDEDLAQAHQLNAQAGQTQKNGHLYELDGRKPFPINHGESTNLLEDSAKVIRKFMDRDPGELQFTVIALAPNPEIQ